jgi:hypothetical protein
MKQVPVISIRKVSKKTFHVRLKITRDGKPEEFVVLPSSLYTEVKDNKKLKSHILTYIE